jgi:hypothetical protein
MLIIKKVSFLLIVFNICALAGSTEETIKAFERRPDYVLPLVTSIGSMTSSGWFVSGELPKNFSYSIALPISLIYLNNSDRQYSGTYIDTGCQECMKQKAAGANVDCRNCVECQQFTAPTIFGTIHTPDTSEVYKSRRDLNNNVIGKLSITPPFSDGADALNSTVLLPFATLQASFSYYYSEIILRYIGIPSIAGISVQFPGIGLRHDFQHFIPSCPVSLSLAATFTFVSATWEPGGNVQGSLHLSGVSDFFGILAGYKATKYLDVFLEAGWEHAFVTPSGELHIIDENDWVRPNKTITGRNGFQMALNVSFPIKYNPVIGGIGGAQFGNLINILSYKSQIKD